MNDEGAKNLVMIAFYGKEQIYEHDEPVRSIMVIAKVIRVSATTVRSLLAKYDDRMKHGTDEIIDWGGLEADDRSNKWRKYVLKKVEQELVSD